MSAETPDPRLDALAAELAWLRPAAGALNRDELLFQIAAYCGAPAGVSARRVVEAVRSERRSER